MLDDGLCLECLLETGMCFRVSGKQQATAGIPIQPVDCGWPALEPERQGLKVVFKAQRPVSWGVDRKPGRFVDDDGLAIEKQDVIGQHGVGHR